jgi:hypothetical protein
MTATQQRVDAWKFLGASDYLYRAIQYGIMEKPTTPFTSVEIMVLISQSPEDLAFAREDFQAGCQEGIFEEVSRLEVEEIRGTCAMVSLSFVM